jgi:pimeloyl-ACP methyl ester carboxylesterase
LAGQLSDQLSITAYDLPSHGGSSDWDGSGDLHDVATDMGRALLKEPMDLIGHSFGATVALRLAIENPELVRSLTMIEPVYFAAALEDHPEQLEDVMVLNQEFEEAWASEDRYAAARMFNRAWGDGTPWAEFSERARSYMAERIHFVPASGPFLHHDSAGLLKDNRFSQAAMPSLLIKGSASPKVAGVINAAIARRLPDATCVDIEGAGHMAPITHPADVAVPIRALLDRS